MIEKIVNKLRSEPIRVRIYTVAALVTGKLVADGVLSADDASFYITLAGIVLAVEGARRKVSPLK